MNNSQKLHQRFVQLGRQRLRLKNEMLLILPEIYRSGIYKKYTNSIVEYAGKFGDIGRSTVIKRLRLEKNLQNKPNLRAAIKEAGIHKVALVAKIANEKNEKIFAEKIKNMSKPAIQMLSKEIRGHNLENPSLCQASPSTIKLELDEESTFLFLKLKNKLNKNASNQSIIKTLLQKLAKQEFPKKKTRKTVTGDTFRYISAKIRRNALAITQGKCGYPGCNKPATIFHHRDRYSESKNHQSIIPLCKEHHEFTHNGLIKNETKPRKHWQIHLTPAQNRADQLYRKYRQEALL
jgi:hypothetical protein